MKKSFVLSCFVILAVCFLWIIFRNSNKEHPLFTLEMTIDETLTEGEPITCVATISYQGTEEKAEFRPTKGIRVIFEHDSGMEITASYQESTIIRNGESEEIAAYHPKDISFYKEQPFVFNCSDYGSYDMYNAAKESELPRFNYRIVRSYTPFFLVAGNYTVYTEMEGILLKDGAEVYYQSPKKSIHVSEFDETQANVRTFQLDDIKGKVFVNKSTYTKEDTFYCFVSYRYIPKKREYRLCIPSIYIKNEVDYFYSDGIDKQGYPEISPDSIIIRTPLMYQSFGNWNYQYLATLDREKEVYYNKISPKLKPGEYSFVSHIGTDENYIRPEIKFTVE